MILHDEVVCELAGDAELIELGTGLPRALVRLERR